jgi:adenine deaminase
METVILAEICFINGRVVNVYSGEVLNFNVAVSEGIITYVGPSKGVIGPRTRVIDVQGDYILPGFFDAHAHADLFYNPCSYANHVVTRGTTCFFNDGHDLANALGAVPFLDMMSGLKGSFMSIYTGVPAASPPYPDIEGGDLWTDADLRRALTFNNVLSISEVTPYNRILKGDKLLSERLAWARQSGRLIEGHTTGAGVEKLNALARAGLTSCHESLNADDVLERVRLGYCVMLRHGSIRQDLPRLAEAIKKLQGFDTSRLMLISDGIFPDHLISRGNMDWVVSEAIKQGIDPIRAIQMATLNPARYFRLDQLLGGVGTGRLAHLQVVESLEKPTPRLVMAKGAVVAVEGQIATAGLSPPAPGRGLRPFKISRIDKALFYVEKRHVKSTVPVIRIVDQTVTDLEEVDIPIAKGRYRPEGDILSVSLISREGAKIGRGFVKGFCPGLGGLASSVAHETHGLLVLGQNEADMALAAGDVLEMGGGISLAQGGQIRANIPLPLGGICSLEEMPALAHQTSRLNEMLRELGCDLAYPIWTLVFLSFTSVLRLRITYQGVYDVRTGKIVF